eukprot:104767-Pelagomonas_calceolata.AAC.4
MHVQPARHIWVHIGCPAHEGGHGYHHPGVQARGRCLPQHNGGRAMHGIERGNGAQGVCVKHKRHATRSHCRGPQQCPWGFGLRWQGWHATVARQQRAARRPSRKSTHASPG